MALVFDAQAHCTGVPKRARDRFQPQAEAEEEEGGIEAIPDPAGINLDAVWDEEWAHTLWQAALGRVKEQVALKQFQMFDLYVVKERPAPEVARALGVTVAQVYLAKHRISAVFKKELGQLKAKLE